MERTALDRFFDADTTDIHKEHLQLLRGHCLQVSSAIAWLKKVSPDQQSAAALKQSISTLQTTQKQLELRIAELEREVEALKEDLSSAVATELLRLSAVAQLSEQPPDVARIAQTVVEKQRPEKTLVQKIQAARKGLRKTPARVDKPPEFTTQERLAEQLFNKIRELRERMSGST